ncbi:hypothetical protein HNP49_003396 [Pseudomonas fluvialis]|uniref:Metallo-beta-lactamase domain-containing protein n=2 Tax=Pseudomonas fluvialis TaxID=1793966 RepID=A0A7X0BV57_9PSED|nr:hypothetical protein [Pseudomonas fluvialis]
MIDPDSIEIATIGPGFGECTLIHVGSNKWIVVDSCLGSNAGEPAAIEYLADRGAGPLDVILIVATHWHDDHIRGLSSLLKLCSNAVFCVSSALTNPEFCQFVASHQKKLAGDKVSSGTSEISSVFDEIAIRSKAGNRPKKALSDRVLVEIPAEQMAHKSDVVVRSLSPSDHALERFLLSLAKYMPQVGQTKYRAPRITENDTSVVLWVSIGDVSILLGSDLEESRGAWTHIVNEHMAHRHKAAVFKVPHHGSKNAHHDQVWSNMLIESPLCLLTPYNRGRKLPQSTDVYRILGRSNNSFASQKISLTPKRLARERDVEKLIKNLAPEIRVVKNSPGIISAILSYPWHGEWKVSLLKGACHLSEIHT